MRLRVLAEPTLTLNQELVTYNCGDEFEVDEERASEILGATYQGKPVAEVVVDPDPEQGNEPEHKPDEVEPVEDIKEIQQNKNKNNNNHNNKNKSRNK